MPLDRAELSAFFKDGVVIRRGLVAPQLVDRAVTLISDWYRNDMDQGFMADYTQRTFAPELGGHPDLLALFVGSGVASLVHDLVGDFLPVATAQVQIRVPDRELEHEQPSKTMHVDGVACPHLDPTELRTFSLLVGVVLSEISDPEGGPLRFLPGGHVQMAEWFRTEWSLGISNQVPPEMSVENAAAFFGAPGDVIFLHHLVPHAVGQNLTGTPRIMAYFRVSHPDHAGRRLDALRDPWLDFSPLIGRIR